MTETGEVVQLNQTELALIQHFGEMGNRWGINRAVGQLYGLLFIHEEAVNPDQIALTLGLSRSNVSMGLKELQSWNLLQTVSKPGDRKTYYSTPADLWEIAKTLLSEKRKRELDPTLSMLRNQLTHESNDELSSYASKRIHEMHDLLEMLVSWSEEMQTLHPTRLQQLFKLGSSINKLLDFTKK